MDYFIKLIKRKYKVDISGDNRALQKLRRECERAKRALSSAHQVGPLFYCKKFEVKTPYFVERIHQTRSTLSIGWCWLALFCQKSLLIQCNELNVNRLKIIYVNAALGFHYIQGWFLWTRDWTCITQVESVHLNTLLLNKAASIGARLACQVSLGIHRRHCDNGLDTCFVWFRSVLRLSHWQRVWTCQSHWREQGLRSWTMIFLRRPWPLCERYAPSK